MPKTSNINNNNNNTKIKKEAHKSNQIKSNQIEKDKNQPFFALFALFGAFCPFFLLSNNEKTETKNRNLKLETRYVAVVIGNWYAQPSLVNSIVDRPFIQVTCPYM